MLWASHKGQLEEIEVVDRQTDEFCSLFFFTNNLSGCRASFREVPSQQTG